MLRPKVKDRSTDGVALKTLRGYSGGRLRPTQRRLRVTWIVGLLNDFIPDTAICAAAGIQELRSFEKYRPKPDGAWLMTFRRQFHEDVGWAG
ncbi:putative phage integrase [Corynebacterium vitaeruminis DSM 20294]|uniref:Putative phage integrase n=1 Tax=Corynebacterium vitaeruminis DSM 20294 TaxID=1224164 RepID=W5XYZ4_9CORY|nr:putative phage integrase [Corynebacterium vitaeruminis DSM 20294]